VRLFLLTLSVLVVGGLVSVVRCRTRGRTTSRGTGSSLGFLVLSLLFIGASHSNYVSIIEIIF
jgi:hypothetical protein